MVVLLFLMQTALGGALAHYRVEPDGFYGFDLAGSCPTTSPAPGISNWPSSGSPPPGSPEGCSWLPWWAGRNPEGQRLGVLVLLGALAIVVFGSLGGEAAGINDKLGNLWFWFGHQGGEYLDLGRFWQVLLAMGLVFWLFLMFRALRPAMRREPSRASFRPCSSTRPSPSRCSTCRRMFYGPHTNFAIIDNWRFWIIHLWVEGFFELFATVLVAVMFVPDGPGHHRSPPPAWSTWTPSST